MECVFYGRFWHHDDDEDEDDRPWEDTDWRMSLWERPSFLFIPQELFHMKRQPSLLS